MAQKKIPPEKWIVEKPFDSSDYLHGPQPRVMTKAEERKFKARRNPRKTK